MNGGSACALLADGTAWCWGNNAHAQLGLGNTTQQNTPQQVTLLGNTVAQIAAGSTHSCARKTDGTVFCWGEGDYVGNGTTSTSLIGSPVDLTTWLGTDNVDVQVDTYTTCVRKSAGGLVCWGEFHDDPMPVEPVAVGQMMTPSLAASVSVNNGCSVRSDQTVWCFGSNQYGQNGNTEAEGWLSLGYQAELYCP